MAIQHVLRIYDNGGTLRHLVDDFRALSYRKEVNAPGLLVFVVDDEHRIVADLDYDWQVEVWRSDSTRSIAWYCDFYGLFRDEERAADNDGESRFTAYCPGQMTKLADSIVAYPANTDGRSAFTNDKAETIAKNLVIYNATSAGGTADGRVRGVDTTGITVQTDGSAGPSLDYNCFGWNLLSALQGVAQIGSGDYDLVNTGNGTAAAWEFRWYDGQLGTDRSGTVTFALQYGNMANPRLTRNRLQERTVAIVAGQGEEDARDFEVRTGTNYSAARSRETLVDARNYSTTAGYQAAGDVALRQAEARDDLTFDVIQVPSTLYGSHYFLGDLVTGYYQGVTATKQITAVSVSVDPAQNPIERIEIETQNV